MWAGVRGPRFEPQRWTIAGAAAGPRERRRAKFPPRVRLRRLSRAAVGDRRDYSSVRARVSAPRLCRTNEYPTLLLQPRSSSDSFCSTAPVCSLLRLPGSRLFRRLLARRLTRRSLHCPTFLHRFCKALPTRGGYATSLCRANPCWSRWLLLRLQLSPTPSCSFSDGATPGCREPSLLEWSCGFTLRFIACGSRRSRSESTAAHQAPDGADVLFNLTAPGFQSGQSGFQGAAVKCWHLAT